MTKVVGKAFCDDAGEYKADNGKALRAAVKATKRFHGRELRISIDLWPTRQGDKALRYLRGPVIQAIAEACGYNPEDPDECQDVYDGVMWRLFRLPDGPFGQPRRESCSKGEMSQQRLSEVIDTIIRWAETTITGCTIPRPEDVDWEKVA